MFIESGDYLAPQLRIFLILQQQFKQLCFMFSVEFAQSITNCNNILMSDVIETSLAVLQKLKRKVNDNNYFFML